MYKSKNLSVLAYANGFTHWHYITDSFIEKCLYSLYFDEAFDMLCEGDMITVVSHNKEFNKVDVRNIFVKELNNGSVTVEEM